MAKEGLIKVVFREKKNYSYTTEVILEARIIRR